VSNPHPDDWDALLAAADAAIDELAEQVTRMVDSGLWPAPDGQRMARGETTQTDLPNAA
jgi:hypothetical protein